MILSTSLRSFNLCTLFTNAPLHETIDLISDCAYSKVSKKGTPFEKTWFKKMLKFATSGLFLNRNGLFRQVNGVAMGSPLGPSFAIFLGHLEIRISTPNYMCAMLMTSLPYSVRMCQWIHFLTTLINSTLRLSLQ